MKKDRLWWLSFCNEMTGSFLGVCLVEALDEDLAIRIAWKLEINPGGTVAMSPWPKEKPLPADKWRHKLLSKDEVAEMERELLSLS